jgi:hypothetical protein
MQSDVCKGIDTYCMDAIERMDAEMTWGETYYERTWTEIPSNIDVAVYDPGSGEIRTEQTNYSQLMEKRNLTLDLIEKSQRLKPRHASWGHPQQPKAFRYQGGQRIREGGAVVDRFCGATNAHMITLTIPGSTYAACDVVARWSGYIVNRLLQVVRRVKSPEAPIYWFFVWEHQKRGALHLHFCLGWNVCPKKREQLGLQIKDKWFEVIDQVGARENIDVFQHKGFKKSWRNHPEKWQWDVVSVKHSVAGYFAKYCAKNAERNGDNEVERDRIKAKPPNGRKKAMRRAGISYPSRYWGSSRTVKNRVRLLTQKRKFETYSGQEAERILSRVRTVMLGVAEPLYVSMGNFEIIDQKSGKVIASGETESYFFRPLEYPIVWEEVRQKVIKREPADECIHAEFLATAYMQ